MSPTSPLRPAVPAWAWLCAAGVVLVGGAWALWVGDVYGVGAMVLLVTASAILVVGRRPTPGLVLLALSVLLQAASGIDLNPAQAFAGVVFFAAGRFGTSRQHRFAAALVGVLGVLEVLAAARGGSEVVQAVLEAARLPALGLVLLAVVGVAVLIVPLLLGIALQAAVAARADERARVLVEEQLAESRVMERVERERARLARDVHDTVGHALTIVITQTRMLAAVADRDPVAAARAAATVESVAGAALEEVRGVLAGAVEPAEVTIEDLVELAGATERTRVAVDGEVPVLSGQVGETAYRAVQELVTNALRHGHPEDLVDVMIIMRERLLEIEVRNALGTPAEPQRTEGSGLRGLQERLTGVGGALEAGPADGRWSARAVIPPGLPR